MQEKKTVEVTPQELVLRLKEWTVFLISKWLIITIVGLIGGLIGFTYAYLGKTVYTATLSFALEEDGGEARGALGLASQLGFDLGGSNAGGAFSSGNLMELMKSRSMVEKTLLDPIKLNGNTISLADAYIEINGWRKKGEENSDYNKVKFKPGDDRSNFTVLQDSILGVIYNDLLGDNLVVAQKDKRTSINIIEVKSVNPVFSKIFAETLASEVSQFYIETKTKKSFRNVAVLQHKSDSIRAELNAAITGVAAMNDNIYNLNPAMNLKRASPAKRQIDIQANTAILTQLLQNLELAKMALMRETPLIQIIDKPILPLTKTKISKRNGLMVGGLIGGFLAVIILLVMRIWKQLFV